MASKATRRRFTGAVDPDVVAARLTTHLGHDVTVLMRQPGNDGIEGSPGLVVIEGPDGEPMHVDSAVIAEAVTDAAPPLSSLRQVLADLDAASTAAAKVAAIRAYFVRQAEEEEANAALSKAVAQRQVAEAPAGFLSALPLTTTDPAIVGDPEINETPLEWFDTPVPPVELSIGPLTLPDTPAESSAG